MYIVENYIKQWHIKDAYNMCVSLYKEVRVLFKMVQNMNSAFYEFKEISIKQVIKIFIKKESVVQRMKNENMRRAMHD